MKMLLLAALSCLSCNVFSQEKKTVNADTINVSGIVYGNDGKPAGSILITAYKHFLNVDGFVYYAKTDSTGRFQLKGLRPNDTITVANFEYYSNYAVAGSRFMLIRLPLKEYKNVGTAEVTAPRVYPKLIRQFNLDGRYPHGSFDNLPEFPGGSVQFIKFIQRNLAYPQKATRYNIEGNVEIAFDVSRDGSIKNARVLKGIGYGCDEEALRIVSASPKWRPGIIWGRSVELTETVIIQFKLTDK